LLLYKKWRQASARAAEMRTQIYTSTVVPTPLPFTSAFKQEMITTEAGHNVISWVTVKRRSIGVKIYAKVREWKETMEVQA